MDRIRAVRGLQVLLIVVILFGIEGARLAWLQLNIAGIRASRASLSQLATVQRSDEIIVDSGRGQFRDRYGRPLTGETVQSLVAFPSNGMQRGGLKDMQKLAAALEVKPQQLIDWLTELRESSVWQEPHSTRALNLSKKQINAVHQADLPSVSILPFLNRYPANITPIHAIGYISQNPERLRQLYGKQLLNKRMKVTDTIGGAGLEKSLDRLLQGIAPTTVLQITNADRQPLVGRGLRLKSAANSHFPIQVTTTLNLDVQRIVDNVMNKYDIHKGAVVVLDAANADILAMVSLPRLDPYHIGAANTDVRNHALVAVPPGSVFKTVTLAAAIESGITTLDEQFHCNGHYGKYGLKCWREEGHGTLTVEQAYAQSCNVVFAELAERMDPAWLQITGDRLGLGRSVGWNTNDLLFGKPLRLLEEEQAGSIFLNPKLAKDGGVRAGSGIGQRDVRVTPLQAANMVVAILNDGRVYSPRLVKELRYADGDLLKLLPIQSAESQYGQIKPRTAALLRDAMRRVVQEGTAANALNKASWPLGGKSGTAELAGKLKARNDHWFVGYGPALGKARYAIAVLIEEQPAGLRNRAASVFGAIIDGIRFQEQRVKSEQYVGPAEER